MEGTRREFIDTITLQYKQHCKSKDIEETIEGLAVYIVNRNLVTDLTINRFLVIDKYPQQLQINYGIKKLAIWALEDIVGVKCTTIRIYLDRFQTHFRYKDRL